MTTATMAQRWWSVRVLYRYEEWLVRHVGLAVDVIFLCLTAGMLLEVMEFLFVRTW